MPASLGKHRGVYFLANDTVLALTITFLNSFRRYNPDLPLCLIPFDENCERLLKLRARYGFSVFMEEFGPSGEAGAYLRSLDQIAIPFHGKPLGHYRKLALWNGPFDEFVYIDVDTVVLDDFRPLFAHLEAYDFVTASSNWPESTKWVWKESVRDTHLLSAAQIDYATNTGFIMSRREALPAAQLSAQLERAQALREHLELACYEQAVLNYLIVTSGARYTSLYCLSLADPPATAPTPLEFWAGTPGAVWTTENQLVPPDTWGRERRVLFMHWAGVYHVKGMERKFHRLLQRLGLGSLSYSVSRFMPYRAIWLRFRRMKPTDRTRG